MEINYKGVLCRLGTYRVNGEDKPTLYHNKSYFVNKRIRKNP